MNVNLKKIWFVLTLLPCTIHARPMLGIVKDAGTAGSLGRNAANAGKVGSEAAHIGGDLGKTAAKPATAKPAGFLQPKRVNPVTPTEPKGVSPATPIEPKKPTEPKDVTPATPDEPKTPPKRYPVREYQPHNGDPLIKVPAKVKPEVKKPAGPHPQNGYTYAFYYKPPGLKMSAEDKMAAAKLTDIAEQDTLLTPEQEVYKQALLENERRLANLFKGDVDGDDVVEIPKAVLDGKALANGERAELANGAKSGGSTPEKPLGSSERVTFTPSEVLDLANGAKPQTPEAAKLAEAVRPKAELFDVMKPRRLQRLTKGASRILNAYARNINHYMRTLYLSLLNSRLAQLAQADYERFSALYSLVSRFFDSRSSQLVAQFARVRSRLPGASSILNAWGAGKRGSPRQTLRDLFMIPH